MERLQYFSLKYPIFAKRINETSDKKALQKEVETISFIEKTQTEHAKEMKEKIIIIKARLLNLL